MQLCCGRWMKWKAQSVCGQTPQNSREAAAAGAFAVEGRPRSLLQTAALNSLWQHVLSISPSYAQASSLSQFLHKVCAALMQHWQQQRGVRLRWDVVQNSLGQILEAFQQAPRCPALFSSQWCHEEMDVVEHGHVIIGVRLSHLEQLAPAILDAHAWHMHQQTHKYGSRAAEKPHKYI